MYKSNDNFIISIISSLKEKKRCDPKGPLSIGNPLNISTNSFRCFYRLHIFCNKYKVIIIQLMIKTHKPNNEENNIQ